MVDFSSLPKSTYDWIKESPRNARRYFDLGERLWLTISRKLNLEYSLTWEYNLQSLSRYYNQAYSHSVTFDPPPKYFFECELAFTTALSLGLSNPLDAAKASFRLIEINQILADAARPHLPNNHYYDGWSTSYSTWRTREKKAESAARSLAKDVIEYTKKYLRRNPHNFEALNMLMAAYTFLNDERGIGEADQLIKKAKSLIAAGIEPVQPQSNEYRSTLQKGIDFEDRVLELIKAMGLQAVGTATSGDGGIDILAYSDQPIYSGKYIIQCKDWTNKIGVSIVRDLYGTVTAEGANKGILITTSQFTSPAQDFVEGKPLELIDGAELAALFNEFVKER